MVNQHRITVLFVNIYSTTHPGGENRGDMRAKKEIVEAARKDVVKSRKKKAGVWDKHEIKRSKRPETRHIKRLSLPLSSVGALMRSTFTLYRYYESVIK
ncbi:hypothetical protein EYF80_020486 [Liparis tanakae]|uniref:Uncharacterized protein n=1 Tax=Liparis tanakae TaxID=230148 RepID=A0A4Z2HVM1_9TELE|nr:hypothetical protein EYF80_020486 [Liparis tanakae]